MKRRIALSLALGGTTVACAAHAPVSPPPSHRPVEDKAYTSCTLRRELELWETAPGPGFSAWPKPKSAVVVRDAYCTVEANRVLDAGVECLQMNDCDDLPGHEVVSVSCGSAPSARWNALQLQALDFYKVPLAKDEAEWHARLGQCYRVTFGGAPAPELAALEAALHAAAPEDVSANEDAITKLIPASKDDAYHRLFLTFAREVTQRRGALVPKAVVWMKGYGYVTRAGAPASLPYYHYTQGALFGFAGHYTTKANAAEDDAYCANLRRDADAIWSGADPVVTREARRNEAIVALTSGKPDARAVLATMGPDLVYPGTQQALARPNVDLHDPCAP